MAIENNQMVVYRKPYNEAVPAAMALRCFKPSSYGYHGCDRLGIDNCKGNGEVQWQGGYLVGECPIATGIKNGRTLRSSSKTVEERPNMV
ncbi:hypothetical protein E5D57_003240 [Metarhizium anisopliae]|nr:hypothetical protein E5D57_003240 [Metarhizium anisopliae]